MRRRQAGEVGRPGAQRGRDVDRDAEAGEQGGDLGDVVAVAEAERGGAEELQVTASVRGTGSAASARTSW
jgi:hypothetical protein